MVDFEIIDDNLLTKLSLRSEEGFLTLVDDEIEAEPPKDTRTVVEESASNINTIIQSVLANQAQPQPDIIYLDGSYEKYKQENPDDLFPHGGWILSKE